MTINGPGPIVPNYQPPPVAPAAPAAPQQSQPVSPAGQSAPEGVNGELWSVLTTDERAYFVDQLQLGALTYGPSRTAPPQVQAPLGTRIDVRA